MLGDFFIEPEQAYLNQLSEEVSVGKVQN